MKIKLQVPYIPVSWGELFDKVTILEIKRANITSPSALFNIEKELSYLIKFVEDNSQLLISIDGLRKDLKNINFQLWEVEDMIRAKERDQQFDSVFIELARRVYKLNDERAYLKKSINILSKSELTEEKSYRDY